MIAQPRLSGHASTTTLPRREGCRLAMQSQDRRDLNASPEGCTKAAKKFTDEGLLYLAVMIDLYTRIVLARQWGSHDGGSRL